MPSVCPPGFSRRLMDWPITQIHRIVRDSRGYLWFCTREGLSRFDGHGFTTYGIDEGLPSAVINDLDRNEGGNLLDSDQ